MTTPNIYTIPPEADFMACLAAGIMADSQAKKIPLIDYRILLPTRRACAILRDAFRHAAHGHSLLLPQLQPLGDMSTEELTLAELSDTDSNFAPIQAAITPLARRLELSALLRRYDPAMPADAAYLRATALTDLLDQTQIERLDLNKLQGLAREDLAAHWQKILDFLTIITTAWPQHLAAKNLIDPATQRDQRITRRAALWQAQPPSYPVIAAGSTGSMPATADLLAVIATLPQGAVILPGLDQTTDDDVWTVITEATHPQFLLKALLERIKCARRHVKLWPGVTTSGDNVARAALLREALAPPIGTGQWRTAKIPPTAWTGLAQCVCETLEHEAQVIALALRGTLETPGRTAALVTRDRQLAARVTAHLQRWHIAIDDSAGQDLTTTPCGAFLLHVLAAAQPETGAVDLLALLYHPLTALGGDPATVRLSARRAERLLWRNRRVRGTLATHAHTAASLAQSNPSKAGRPKITAKEAADLAALFQHLDRCLRPLTTALSNPNITLAAILAAHLTAAEAIATAPTESGATRLWGHDDGDAAATLLHELATAMPDCSLTQGDEYPALLRQIFVETTVRPRFGTHPRLSILGPLEARFTTVDVTIIGGMNEGSWPPASVADPWLSRPMRKNFGLPAFERQIGQAAHDFVQLASRGDVLLTRASRVDSKPTTPSRFLWRLDTLRDASTADAAARAALMRPEPDWCAWAQQMDKPEGGVVTAMPPPKPCPVVARRPTRFSVTEIGGWRRNPYGFYAKHVLRLRPLGELDPDFTRADQGNIVHDVLHDFIRQHQQDFPAQDIALTELLALGRDAFAPIQDQPAIYAAWWARFENSARWFVTAEQRQRATLRPVALETEATLPIPIDGVTYTLRGRPDRIDAGSDGLTITDYKTGSVPTGKQIEAGYEPQLPLLGLMAEQGVFTAIGARPVAALLHWRLQGRATTPDTRTPIKDPVTRIADARTMLVAMLRNFAVPTMPYLVTPQPRFIPRYDDYRHLGRIDEWGAPGDADD
jgi:ATP-dependent helicase/nuclease subunit B